MKVASAERLRDMLRSMFWLPAALSVVASVGAAIGLVALDHSVRFSSTSFLYPGPPAGARSFLSSITQAMISFTGLVFTITIIVLQLTSAQFSPRALRMFLRDRTIQLTLGVFISTAIYAMTVQREVTGSAGHHPFVPRVAVTGAFILVLTSAGLFVRYIDHVANMIRVVNILGDVAGEARALIETRYPAGRPPVAPPPAQPPAQRQVAADRPGAVVSVNEQALVRLAGQAGLVVRLIPRVGDFVPAGAPLVSLHPDGTGRHRDGQPADRQLRAEISQDRERTLEQDLAFGFRQLVDVAERALSPAVNDPTTASQAIDMIHDLLRRLASRHLPAGVFEDGQGRARLIVPQYGFADFLDLTVGEIWRYGAGAAQIPGRLEAMLADLATAAMPEHLPAVGSWADRIGGRAIGGQAGVSG